MKTPQDRTDSLKKVLSGSRTFDEANYYKSKQVEMGGEDAIGEDPDEIEEEDDDEEEEIYGDDE